MLLLRITSAMTKGKRFAYNLFHIDKLYANVCSVKCLLTSG